MSTTPRDGAIQDGMRVRVTLTTEYEGSVTDYEKGYFIRIDGRRGDLTDADRVEIIEIGTDCPRVASEVVGLVGK